jgi:pyruvate/2-oxoglutarate dehydrogenase complex dihydrolipoamide acyltransferase (E2) component
MTSHVGRLYTLAIALLIFFVTWATVAAKPWTSSNATAAKDPRLAALAAREQRIRHESVVVARIVRHRWTVYRVALRKRQAQIAAAKQAQVAAASAPAPAPSVQVVSLPPLTVTRTS